MKRYYRLSGSPRNIWTRFQEGVFRSIMLLFAATFAPNRIECESDLEW
jgi:hypothetical protein